MKKSNIYQSNIPQHGIRSSSTLLRTLTPKSTLNFGKYAEWKVQALLLDERVGALLNAYYTKEGISFIDEILFHIGIVDDFKIRKPGKLKNEKVISAVISKAFDNYYNPENEELRERRKKQWLENAMQDRINAKSTQKERNRLEEKKSFLRAKNQGR